MKPSIILNCTPPYDNPISNPALGYLKGFLEAREITVKNVYWNLILARPLSKFQRGLEKYIRNNVLLHIFPAVYLCRQLLTEGSHHKVTPLDLFYSSVYSREEIAETAHSIKDFIDQYIRQNNLHEAALAGFTFKTYQWIVGYCIVQRLKEMNPGMKIVIGGITNQEQAAKFLHIFSPADIAIYGEGEYPLFSLIKTLEEDADMKNVPNMVYRERKKILSTNAFYKSPPLDEYPFADHSDYFDTLGSFMSDLVFQEQIRTFTFAPGQFPVLIPIWGSRSCPWNKCRFCVLNEEYSYRTRSPKNIVEEIEYQSKKHNIYNFIFVDTELPGNLKRFKTLLKLLMKSSADQEKKYRFFAELSPIFINPSTAKYMQLASLIEVQIGFEAMTDSLLEKMRKRHQFAHNIQALKLGNQYGLHMGGLNIMRGIPTETTEDIIESCSNLKFLRFLLNRYPLDPDFLRLDKGAPFYDDVPEEKREKWINSPIWKEVEPIHLIPESDRFEFFGFGNLDWDRLWSSFERLLEYYIHQDCSYEWTEYPHGSFIEEKSLHLYKYVFDRDETDLLIFCDTIRTLSDVKKRFPHLSEDTLYEILQDLKKMGVLYYDKDFKWIISVVEAAKRKVLEY